jgi:acyl carrier protein
MAVRCCLNQTQCKIMIPNEKLRHVISETCNVPLESITTEARLVEDLGLDSLDRIELIMAIEEEFDCMVDEETEEAWNASVRTVGDLEEAVAEIAKRIK